MAPQKKVSVAEAHQWIQNAISHCQEQLDEGGPGCESSIAVDEEFLEATRPVDFKETKKSSTSSDASDRSEERYDPERCDARASKKKQGVRFEFQCSSKKRDGKCLCKNHLNKFQSDKGLELGLITEERPTHWPGSSNDEGKVISWHDADPGLLATLKKTLKNLNKVSVGATCLKTNKVNSSKREIMDTSITDKKDEMTAEEENKKTDYVEIKLSPHSKGNQGLKNEEKCRKNCENNWAELVVCLMILYPEIQTKEAILQRIDDLILNPRFFITGTDSDCNIEKYAADIKLRPDIRIQEFISNFDKTIFQGDFIKIILSGKSFKEFPELVTLNTNPTTGQLYDKKQMKSDIYIVYSDSYIGISVKDSSIATLTNYSIEGMFHKLQIPNNLKEKRINMLKEEFSEGYKYKKEQRKEANKLFYDKNNEYFKKIIEIIEDHNDIFTGHLVSCVFPKLEYDVYGYNGTVLKDLNSLSSKIHGQSQMIKRENKYETETAAKIWFSLYLDDVESWKFCIRGKNDIYKGSFQVLEFQKIH